MTSAPKSISDSLKDKRHTHAKNALKEANARKQAIDQATIASKNEKEGRGGLDPTRFGDWEVKGVASDF